MIYLYTCACRCACFPSFTGARCESRYIPCSPSLCLNGGSCVVTGLLDYRCHCVAGKQLIGPILWGHSGPLCHALSLSLLFSLSSLWTSILHCHSPGVTIVARRLRYSYSWLRLILVLVSTVATAGEWQCKIRTGGVWWLAVANGPNIFQMLLD